MKRGVSGEVVGWKKRREWQEKSRWREGMRRGGRGGKEVCD